MSDLDVGLCLLEHRPSLWIHVVSALFLTICRRLLEHADRLQDLLLHLRRKVEVVLDLRGFHKHGILRQQSEVSVDVTDDRHASPQLLGQCFQRINRELVEQTLLDHLHGIDHKRNVAHSIWINRTEVRQVILIWQYQTLTTGKHVRIFRVDFLLERGISLWFVGVMQWLRNLMTKDGGKPPVGESIPLGGGLKQRVKLHGFLHLHQLFVQTPRCVRRVDRDPVVGESREWYLGLGQNSSEATPEFLGDLPPREAQDLTVSFWKVPKTTGKGSAKRLEK